jgi:serine/threonine protein kinase
MATGQVPFDDPNVARLHELIKTGQLEYPSTLSKPLRALLERMLTVDPHRRATLTEVMNSAWTTEGGLKPMPYAPTLGRLPESLDEQIIERLADLFGYECPRRQILSTLHDAATDWVNHQQSPIVRLYLLLARNKSALRESERHSIADLRSRSDVNDESGTTGASPIMSIKRAASVLCRHDSAKPAQPKQPHLYSLQRSSLLQTQTATPPPDIPPCTSPLSSKDLYPLHAPTLRNLLTATGTSVRSTAALRRQVMRALDQLQFRFEDRLNHFVVDCSASAGGTSDGGGEGECKFEVHLVHGVGGLWLQFHRVHGGHHLYKTVVARLLSEMKLN